MEIRVTTHSGEEKIIEVAAYGETEAEELTKKRNDHSIESIQLGVFSLSRIDIKNVEPYNSQTNNGDNT